MAPFAHDAVESGASLALLAPSRHDCFTLIQRALYPFAAAAVLGSASLGCAGSGDALATGGAAGPDSAPGASGGASGSTSDSDDGCPSGAFVSLTYDDSLPSHLSTAVPALDARGLVGTFFVTNIQSNSSAWGALTLRGHELGSHTRLHPCPASNSWVAEGNANEDYDLSRMQAELDEQIALLESLGQPQPLSFAYPCGVDWVGAEQNSYVPLLEERFLGARGVSGGRVTALTDPFHVPAYFLTGSAEQLIAAVSPAVSEGSWVVYGFHGVGGDHSAVTAEAHEALLDYLVENQIPVRTFARGLACKTQ